MSSQRKADHKGKDSPKIRWKDRISKVNKKLDEPKL